MSRSLSWGNFSATELSQQFAVKGEVSLVLFFPPTAALSTREHPQSLHHPLLPNEHWGQCAKAQEEDIQQHWAATSAPPVTTQPLGRGKHKAPYTAALNPTLMQ